MLEGQGKCGPSWEGGEENKQKGKEVVEGKERMG